MAKSLDDKLSRAVEKRDSLAIDLAKKDLGYEVNKGFKDFIVRSRLKRVPNEAMKGNMLAHEEEVQRFLHWYIKSMDEHVF